MARKLILRHRRGTEAQWEDSTIVPYDGEIIVATDTHRIKVGDGIHTWGSLAYVDSITEDLLNSHTHDMYINQNAFSNITIDDTTITADTTTDTLNIIAGSNITITPNIDNDTVTIEATDTTYNNATTSLSGLMSNEDKTKLDSIAEGAEANVQADWNATEGDSKILNKPTEFNPSIHTHNISDVDELQTILDNKSNSTHTHSEYIQDVSNKVDKIEGKGLSTNDYTTEEKNKLLELENTVIVNNLASDSVTQALSAAMGKVLKQSVDDITSNLEDLGGGDMMKTTYDIDRNGIVDNSQRLEGHDASYFAKAEDIPSAGTSNPIMDGVASAGTATSYSREDHQHPSDGSKVDKVAGKQLSTEDYTTEEKTKLSTLENTVIINNLTSDSSVQGLSAAMGKSLKQSIDDITNNIGDFSSGDMEQSVYDPTNKNQDIFAYIDTHKNNTNNPHSVTANQVGALPLTGGTMTGEVVIGQGSGNGIQLGQNGKINVGDSPIIEMSSGELYSGNASIPMKIRGSQLRPTYNDNDIALSSDIVASPINITTKRVICENITLASNGTYTLPTPISITDGQIFYIQAQLYDDETDPDPVLQAPVGLFSKAESSQVQWFGLNEPSFFLTETSINCNLEQICSSIKFTISEVDVTVLNDELLNFLHLEGFNSYALAPCTHAEGAYTRAYAVMSHTEGLLSTSLGIVSHAEGMQTTALGTTSHVEGTGTVSGENSSSQHVQGQYNVVDNDGIYAHIIGNGTEGARSNAHTVKWNGDAWYAGDITDGSGNTLSGLSSNISVIQSTLNAMGESKADINHTHNEVTISSSGLMSNTDKIKLDGIAEGAEVNVQADWNANSGDAQILNKPTIPTKTSNLTNDSNFVISTALATVATTGSYNDLSDKPIIPETYTLPVASTEVLGGVKSGADITVDSSGNVTVNNDSHTHSDYVPKAGTTMTGVLTALNPAINIEAVRNIYAGTEDMTAGTTLLNTGSVYFVYE